MGVQGFGDGRADAARARLNLADILHSELSDVDPDFSPDGGKTWTQGAPGLPPALAKGYFFNGATAVDAKGTLVGIASRLGKPAVTRSSDDGQHWDARAFEGFDWLELATDGAGHARRRR